MKTMRFLYDWIGVVWWLFALLVFLAFCWEYDEPDAASEWYGEGGW